MLEELGALDDDGELTRDRRAARPAAARPAPRPDDPRRPRRARAARGRRSSPPALGLQDPRERPQAAQQQADEAHRKFRDEGSDFVGYLKLWEFWQDARARSCRGASCTSSCRENFLSFIRMREWEDVHEQLVRVMRELRLRAERRSRRRASRSTARCCPGLLSKIGMWNPEARIYVGARQTRFLIHPSSGLARSRPRG